MRQEVVAQGREQPWRRHVALTACAHRPPKQVPCPHPAAHLGGHAATEERRGGEVPAVAGVCCAHHVLGVPHLLRELRHSQAAVLLAAAGGEGREAHLSGREGKGQRRVVGTGHEAGDGQSQRGGWATSPPSLLPAPSPHPARTQPPAHTMKKCRRGKGIRLTASLRRSEFSWPGNRRQQVMPAQVGTGVEGGQVEGRQGRRAGAAAAEHHPTGASTTQPHRT